jgi:hypothetical protein
VYSRAGTCGNLVRDSPCNRFWGIALLDGACVCCSLYEHRHAVPLYGTPSEGKISGVSMPFWHHKKYLGLKSTSVASPVCHKVAEVDLLPVCITVGLPLHGSQGIKRLSMLLFPSLPIFNYSEGKPTIALESPDTDAQCCFICKIMPAGRMRCTSRHCD